MSGIGRMVLMVVVATQIGCGAVDQGGGGGALWSNPRPQSHGGPVVDQVSFVDALRGRGVTVSILGEVEQVFLMPKGNRMSLSGGPLNQPAEVQSFSYETLEAAQADMEHITPDGQTPTTMITWIDDPHFYRRERLIVLYVGKDPAVIQLLAELLGDQFAGR